MNIGMRSFALGLFCLGVISSALSQPIREEEYAARRARLLAKLDTSAIVVMRSAESKQFTNDVNYRYRQESNFLYLTGVNEPSATLVLTSRGTVVDGKTVHAMLFAKDPPNAPFRSPDECILDPGKLSPVLQDAMGGITTMYLSMPDVKFTNDWLNNHPLFLDRDVKKEFEQKHPGVKIKSAASLLTDMRLIKSPAELALIRKAIDITGKGIVRAMKECAPGLPEYILQADVEYEMFRGGAITPSYPSIIGSGPNSLIPHYEENRRTMEKGEMVVMDVGAEFEGYAADVTRSIPVSGRFAAAQREVYNVVRKAQEAIFARIKPGLPWRDIDATAKDVIAKAGYQKFILHGVTHFVGLDVHDAGIGDTLQAGMVLTVEPGIYIPADASTVGAAYRGWGIRIEDDVLVTPTGCEILTRNIPRASEDIEKVMKK